MRKKFNVFLTLLLALVVQITFAQEKSITGVVTDAADGSPMPGVNVLIKGTQKGAATDFDGKYSIKANVGDVLVFSYTGYADVTKKVTGATNRINVTLKEGGTLGTVVIEGARGIKVKPKEVSYAQQVVKSKELSMGHDNNIKTALSGKIASVQVAGQAGSKLGRTGKVYIRNGGTITGRAEAIYIVDGVQVDPSSVDMDNVEYINVLKGPAAVALYGSRGANGVILIKTKKGKKGKVNVELFNTTTFDKVAYLPNYQNEYGQGYDEAAELAPFSYVAGTHPSEWSVLDGVRVNGNPFADESWGAKFDGEDYAPWYAWFPGENNENPYFGKAQKYVAQPDNVKNFYDTGVMSKTGFAISGGVENANARISYSRIDQNGLVPSSSLKRDMISANISINLTKKITMGVNVGYSTRKVHGDFSDSSDFYANPNSGSFNQWFGRNLEMDKLRELKDLTTVTSINVHPYHASWNWWGPDYYTMSQAWGYGDGFRKPVFWFNPYWQNEQDQYDRNNDQLTSVLNLGYKVTDKFTLRGKVALYNVSSQYSRKTPYSMQYSSNYNTFGYTSYLNSMTESTSDMNNLELTLMGEYNTKINDNVKLGFVLGGESRKYTYESLTSSMFKEGNPGIYGFNTPDLYNFNNAKQIITPRKSIGRSKKVLMFGRTKVSYKDYLFVDVNLTNEWASPYDIAGEDNQNSFIYGSAGLSFIFTKAMEKTFKNSFINNGKFRASIGRVGHELGYFNLNPAYRLSGSNYDRHNLLLASNIGVNRDVKPSTSTQFEVGLDLKMLKKLSLSLTYFAGHDKDAIIPSTVEQASGLSNYYDYYGDLSKKGFEVELGVKAINKKDFKWNVKMNWATTSNFMEKLAPGRETMFIDQDYAFGVISLVSKEGEEAFQLVGNKIKRDDDGNAVLNADGSYKLIQNQNFGSVTPDFTGGLINSFSYKGFNLSAAISFQKGGKFFSLTEWWGTYTGLLAETAGKNDRGGEKRGDIADDGGVHVTGVDESGNPVDMYMPAHDYYQQQYSNKTAEGFVHDASYIKLSEISLSYNFPKKILGKYIKGAQIGVVARNLGMIAVSSENKHNWDPSEMGRQWGESAQLPGTRNIGFNIRLKL